MLALLAPGVGMGGSSADAPPIAESVSGGRNRNRLPVSFYCLAPLLLLLEYAVGR
jgi:hypothetical protein